MSSTKSIRLVCRALNRIFWKCRPPARVVEFITDPQEHLNIWAKYWLAELAEGDCRQSITGIVWDGTEFKPERRKRRKRRKHS